MSSIGAGHVRWWCFGLAPLAVLLAFPASGQESITAQEALENARDVYYAPGEQYVSACPDNTAEGRAEGEDGNVIVVCRRPGPANTFQTRETPRPRLDQTADGSPRAPDVSTIPPCHGGAMSVCMSGLGSVPPPVLMVDVTAFPEPLSPEDAAAVFRAPAPVTDAAGEREMSIPPSSPVQPATEPREQPRRFPEPRPSPAGA